MQVAHGAEDVAGILDGEEAVLDERRMDRLGHHAEQVDVLLRHRADHIE
ncbi:hypothetical protein SDC9_186003 [bioreactor metagenome]|uniref:Uncharacterized protein n=1 Tax=bioreactor metagenome TaxID=1076179 RepID=A0A645HJV9_9ZZZZ